MTKLKTVLGILFALILFSPPLLHAQVPQEPAELQELPPEEVEAESPLSFGLKVGMADAWLRNSDSTIDDRFGLSVGFYGNYKLNSFLGAQLEFLYSSKGYKTSSRDITLDYLEMPLMVTASLPQLGPIRPTLLTGPTAALRLRTKYGTARSSRQDEFKADVNRWEIGWTAGANLELALPYGAVFVEGRYNFGLTQAFVEGSVYGTGDDKNRSIVGYIGYRF